MGNVLEGMKLPGDRIEGFFLPQAARTKEGLFLSQAKADWTILTIGRSTDRCFLSHE